MKYTQNPLTKKYKKQTKKQNRRVGLMVGGLISLIVIGTAILNSKYYNNINNLVNQAPVIKTEFTHPENGFYGFYSAEDTTHNKSVWDLYMERVRSLNQFDEKGNTLDGKIYVLDLDRDGSVGKKDTEKN